MKPLMRAGIALGSNEGDRMAHLRAGCAWLETVSKNPVRISRVYETDPVDCPPGRGPFLNAVCEITCEGDALDLLKQLHAVERQRGRRPSCPKNAPRPLDMDLLYAGDLVVQTAELILPHPRMLERRFVLQPLCDIRPDLVLPGQNRNISQILAGLKDDKGVRLWRESLR